MIVGGLEKIAKNWGPSIPDISGRISREANMRGAFPLPGTPTFVNSLNENWSDVINGKTNGKSFSSFLARSFKSKKNRPDRFYIFVLWLCLCIDRPWNKEWRFLITDNRERTGVLNKAQDLLEKYNIPASDLPDPSTLRKRLRQEDALDKIINATVRATVGLTPDLLEDLSLRSPKGLLSELFKSRICRIRMGFIVLIKNGPTRKWTMMRKLRITKNELDQLISWAGDRVRIEDQGRGRGGVWIQGA